MWRSEFEGAYFPWPPEAPAPLAAVPAEDDVLVLDDGAAVADDGEDTGEDAEDIAPEYPLDVCDIPA